MVVPRQKARIRAQVSAAHSDAQLEHAAEVLGRRVRTP
jgi:7-keto-8-aminopelargonate synthetase-like enzyme